MKRSELEHLLRAAGSVLNEKQFIVIGSQSILGRFPDAPAPLLISAEIDVIAKNRKSNTDILEAIGEASRFHDEFGYYIDPVDTNTAVLPKDWKARLVNVSNANTGGVTGLCLDPHDLFVSKIAAGRDKDILFVRTMALHDMVDPDRVIELAKTVPNTVEDLDRSARLVRRIERLYRDLAPELSRDTPDRTVGRYTGEIRYYVAVANFYNIQRVMAIDWQYPSTFFGYLHSEVGNPVLTAPWN